MSAQRFASASLQIIRTRDKRGEWIENVKWNEVTIFNEATQGFVKRNLTKGDLVYADGILGQTSYERDGERVYGMTLACQRSSASSKPTAGRMRTKTKPLAPPRSPTPTFHFDGRLNGEAHSLPALRCPQPLATPGLPQTSSMFYRSPP